MSSIANSVNHGGRCIFCHGVANMTRGHVLPSRLRDHFERLHPKPQRSGFLRMQRNEVNFTFTRNTAEALHIAPRVLCVSCNGGWMNSFEVKGVPLMVDLLDGNMRAPGLRDLSPNGIVESLASWAVCSYLLFEYRAMLSPAADPHEPSVSSSIPYTFYADGFEAGDFQVGVFSLLNTRATFQDLPVGVFTSERYGFSGHMMVMFLDTVAVVVAFGPLMKKLQALLRSEFDRSLLLQWPLYAGRNGGMADSTPDTTNTGSTASNKNAASTGSSASKKKRSQPQSPDLSRKCSRFTAPISELCLLRGLGFPDDVQYSFLPQNAIERIAITAGYTQLSRTLSEMDRELRDSPSTPAAPEIPRCPLDFESSCSVHVTS